MKLMIPRLKEFYKKDIQPSLKDSLGLKNIYMTPKIEKIVLNMGLGLDGNDSKTLKSCEEDLAKIKEINMVKKHVKTTKEKKGGIISKESFIHLSNLKLINEKNKTKKHSNRKIIYKLNT